MIKRLWIAEKPSAARSLAAGICCALKLTVVNSATSNWDGYLELSNGEIVTHLLGHLLTAKFLSAEHKTARQETYFDFLPVVVKDFEYEPRFERARTGELRMDEGRPVPMRQYLVVRDLIHDAVEIVNAGDIDREGQLIVDELLIHCGVDPEGSNKPIWRLPLVSARAEDISKQVSSLSEKNGDAKWVRRRYAALARQHCDAAVGMNGSMAYQAATGYKRASVGRVQTPVLCLVVDREAQVGNFKSQNYYVPVVTLNDGTVLKFFKRKDGAGTAGFDEEGRIIDQEVGKRICALLGSGLVGQVVAAKKVKGTESPPLPFSATVLASTVSKRTGMLPTQVDAVARSLYENHKAITYIGTDCQYLPTAMLAEVPMTITALSQLFPQQVGGAILELRSKAWNDSKVEEHFAIIPNGTLPNNPTAEEKHVYEAIACRYMAQFYPSHEFVTSHLTVVFGNDEFRATKQETTRMGWKEIEGHLEQGGPRSEDSNEEVAVVNSTSAVNVDAYQVGQDVTAASATFKTEKTTAPVRYDMATILDAMLSADRFARTEEDKKILRSVDGIGTARTRQGIVDGLIQKGLLYTERKGKRHELRPYEIATQLRSKLPPILCDVTMTAKWELGFSLIEKGDIDWRQVVDRTYLFVEQIVAQAKKQQGSFILDIPVSASAAKRN